MRFTRHSLLVLCLIILSVSVLLTACQSSGGDTSLADVKKKGVILVATDDTYPPLEYNDNGKIVGYDMDIMSEVASRLGVKAEFVSTKWDGLLTGLAGKQFDAVISTMNITEGRLKEANFVEYRKWAQVIVMSPEVAPIADLAGLEGLRIAVQISTTSEDIAKSTANTEVTSFESFDTTFMELKNGRCDAIIIDEPVAMYYQKKDPAAFRITGTADETAPVGIAIRKDALKLQEAVSKAVADMEKDGKAGEIFDKWFK